VYCFHHARSPAVTYPGHAWLPVPPRKELRPRSPALRLEGGITPQPVMTQHDAASTNMEMPEEESIHLSLPGLLPENHTLVLNPAKRIVVLLHDEPGGGARSVKEQLFTPSAMRILIPLLQAYPNYCPYEVLLAQLYPITVEEGRKQLQEAREPTMRPLRRAIGSITAGLRPFGLRVCSLRSVGFVLQRLA
jgi:hypothetical protein